MMLTFPLSSRSGGAGTFSTVTVTGAANISGGTTSNTLVVATSESPASNAAGTAGQITWDASYIYVCTATGVWKRVALTGAY